MDDTPMTQTNGNFSFVFDAVINDETQTHDVFVNALWFNLDLDYYSSNVNIFQLNYTKCVENIMNLNAINQTTNHGIHPCYVMDLTNNPTRHPTNNPSSNPTFDPSKDPTHNPPKYTTLNPSRHPSVSSTSNPSILPTLETFDPSHYPTHSPTLDPIIAQLLSTHVPNNAPTDQVSTGNETFARDNVLTYVLIGIGSLLLVVCSVGVILLFCIYKKKDRDSEDTSGMDFGDDYNKN
eukprot:194835_1